MNGVHKIATTLTGLLAIAGAAGAAEDTKVSAREAKFLQSLAPDAAEWSKLDDGVFLGIATGNEVVKVYNGQAGARAYVATLREKLARALVAEGRGEAKARADARALGAKLAAEIAVLEQGVGAREFTGKSSYERVYVSDSPQACTVFYGLESRFTAAYNTIVDTPLAVANSAVSSPGFGPYLGPPYNVYRSVSAEVSGVSNFAATIDRFANLSTNATTMTFTGSCGMQTSHVVDAACGAAQYETFYAITRTQTCSGVINDDPPGVYTE